MADIKYVLSGPETIAISAPTADKLIRAGNGDAVLLYLYILKTGGAGSTRSAAAAIGRTDTEISSAMELLDKLGLIKYDMEAPPPAPVQKDEPPEYTAADIKRELDGGSAFASLVQEIQRSLGKILSSDDLMKLFGIYDNLGLPPEVILQLVTHCISESRRRYGNGRLPTMRYIEKAAYTWEREGLFSLELAENYIKELESRRGAVAEIKNVLQIKDRLLSSTERKYVESWIALGFGPDAIELAYDKTLVKTGKLAWGYMNSIINSWNGKGLHNVGEIGLGDGRGNSSAKKQSPEQASSPSEAELDRMKKLLEKIKEE